MAWAQLLAQLLRQAQPPKLRILVNGEVAYVGLAVPPEEDLQAHALWPGQPTLTLEDWALDLLDRLATRYPEAKTLEFWGVWGGDPPLLTPLVRFSAKGVFGAKGVASNLLPSLLQKPDLMQGKIDTESPSYLELV